MSGRRRHPRFSVLNTWGGDMRVLRDVTIDRIEHDELLAVSQAPAVTGEHMSLDLSTAGASVEVKVKVLESRPVVVGGSVRHRLRLAITAPEPETVLAGASVAALSDAFAEGV